MYPMERYLVMKSGTRLRNIYDGYNTMVMQTIDIGD